MDTALASTHALTILLSSCRFRADRMRAATQGDFSTATDLADHLTQQGMPFREAHEVVGCIVRECERLGLFNRVVPHSTLADATYSWARSLAHKPALALSLAKRAIYESLDRSLPEMLDYELDAQMRCFESGDAGEGIRAFTEKRTAKFGTAH